MLYTAGQPDPDLLIRTSGEMRVSNFLLWQIAYAEIWVTDTLWPDFRCRHLLEGVVAYQKRDRRFGGITPPVPPRWCPLIHDPRPQRRRPRRVALALIWFLDSTALLGVALVVVRAGVHEYARIVDAIGAKVPCWTTLLATLLACAMVPFQWVDIEVGARGAAAGWRAQRAVSTRVGAPLLADTAAACSRRSTSACRSGRWSACTRSPAAKRCCC